MFGAVRPRFGPLRRNPLTGMAAGTRSVRSSVGGARNRLGRGGWFGRVPDVRRAKDASDVG